MQQNYTQVRERHRRVSSGALPLPLSLSQGESSAESRVNKEDAKPQPQRQPQRILMQIEVAAILNKNQIKTNERRNGTESGKGIKRNAKQIIMN